MDPVAPVLAEGAPLHESNHPRLETLVFPGTKGKKTSTLRNTLFSEKTKTDGRPLQSVRRSNSTRNTRSKAQRFECLTNIRQHALLLPLRRSLSTNKKPTLLIV